VPRFDLFSEEVLYLMKKKYIIIGASAAGIACANRLRQLDAESEILCISQEKEIPYNKCFLADYCAGLKQEEEILILTQAHAVQKNIQLMLDTQVVDINASAKTIALINGAILNYDALVIATGTSPKIPHAFKDMRNVFMFHRLSDVNALMNFIRINNAKKAVVVGSGLSGLECADALQHQNVQVTVVELQDRVLATHVDEKGSRFIERQMKNGGINFIANTSVVNIENKDNRSSVHCADGTIIYADVIVFAIGLQPNLDLAQKAELAVHDQGIITDDYMRTSNHHVLAAGDIAMVRDQLTQQLVPNRTWPDAMLQGLIAAHSIAGQVKKYPGLAAVISSSFFGIKFASCGPIVNPPSTYQILVNEKSDYYHLFLLDNGLLKGFLLVGNTGSVGKLRQHLLTKTPISIEFMLSL
jgi:nitrite reductase (NADH) large subunit